MDISELQRIYAGHPNTAGLAALLEDSSVRTIFLGGLHASATPLFISSFIRENKQTFVFILGDQEEAGYFYHDLTQVNGEENILFFPHIVVPSNTGKRMRQMRFFARKY